MSAFVMAVAWAPSGAAAQTIATDRPGFAFNPLTVPAGGLQCELGLPALDFAGSGDDPAAAFVPAFRYGVTDRVEARLSTVYFARTAGSAGEDGPSGFGGLRAGAKLGVLSDPAFSLALIPEVVLPVGDDELAGDRAAFSLNASADLPVGSAAMTLVAGAQWSPFVQVDAPVDFGLTDAASDAIVGVGLSFLIL